ncbi:MAG: GNAT family N-acetyltransferase [Verrucomicrobia bacterium]|nr:GNAT family N-acetyltransferase [Verrucomicrobiota bacterium]
MVAGAGIAINRSSINSCEITSPRGLKTEEHHQALPIITKFAKGQVILRKAVPEDWLELASLHYLSHTVSFQPYASQDWLESRDLSQYEENWKERLSDNRIKVWVAKNEDDIVGMVSIRPDPIRQYSDESGKIAFLGAMHVHPKFMGNGLGRRLVNLAVSHMRSHNYTTAYLCVMKENTRALRFFESAGWRIQEFLPDGDEGVPRALCRFDLSDSCK